MTLAEQPAAHYQGLGAQIWDNLGKVPGCAVIAGVLYAVMTWGIGPVKPQSQIDLDQQRSAVAALAADLAKQTAALAADMAKQTSGLASDQAARASGLSQEITAIKASPGGQLRQQDITVWTTSLTELRGLYEAQRAQVDQTKFDIRELQGKYQALTTIPTPGPRR